METKDVIILTACLLLAGFSLYRKYMKNKANGTSEQNQGESRSVISQHSRDDDYEPYSGKKN